MDFGTFGFTPEQRQEFWNYLASQQAQAGNGNNATNQQSATPNPPNTNENRQQEGNRGAAGDGNDGQNQGEPVLMHNAQHNGVVCDACNTEIRGFRYKCMQCPDYDLCGKCEHRGHHAGHIMMRISFPEQARDAINKYLNNGGRSPPTSPPPGPHRGPFPGPGLFGFGSHHGHGPHHRTPNHQGRHGWEDLRRSGCHRRASGRHGGDDSDEPTAENTTGCPYNMGKKEFKKWSKWMKRAAAHHHRSAEAYARAAAASGNGATNAEAGASNTEPEFDFTAVASQIQQFLNYWGIPVDVVELYDQFGNRSNQSETADQQATSAQQNEPNSANAGTQETTGSASATESPPANQDQQPASPIAANLSENMEQMRINEPQTNAGASASAAGHESLLMDLDTDNAGWTIIIDDPQSREQSPGNSNVGQPETVTDQQNVNQATAPESVQSNNGSTPFASVASSTSSGQSTAAPSAPSFPTGVPNVPLYPVLNPPQIQQILQGVSSAVNSVVRSIPIVTDPRGPMSTNVTNTTGGQVPSTGSNDQGAQGGNGNPEMDGRSMKTLNQLLAMGFSNEGGYLTRLVVAKNGDLEAVLSSLFPN